MCDINRLLIEFSGGLVGFREFQDIMFSGKLSKKTLDNLPLCIMEFFATYEEPDILQQLELRDMLIQYWKTNKVLFKRFSEVKNFAFDFVNSEIQEAFKNTELGNGMTLAQAHAIDGYQSEEEQILARDKDKEISWQNYPVQDLEGFTSLPYLDNEGFAYYVPAYMLWCVNNCFSEPYSNIESMLFGSFDPELYGSELRLNTLNEFQKNSVMNFLWLFAVYDKSLRENCIESLSKLGGRDFLSRPNGVPTVVVK